MGHYLLDILYHRRAGRFRAISPDRYITFHFINLIQSFIQKRNVSFSVLVAILTLTQFFRRILYVCRLHGTCVRW